MKKATLIIIVSFVCLNGLFAGQHDDLFQQANDAYQSNDFGKAIGLYEQIDSMGFQSTELEYNMANAYFRKGKKGKAILHYERALLLSPGDEDVLHNLSLAQQQVKNREQLPDFFLTVFWKNMQMALASDAWGILATVLWWIGFGGLCLWLLGKSREQRKLGFSVGIAAIFISILPAALAWGRMSHVQNSRQAIVLISHSQLKSAPDEAGSATLQLNEGEKIDLVDHLGGYWQVRLTNGEKGWVAESEVEQI